MKKIKLWKNKNELSDKVAIVDDEDFELVENALLRYKKDGTISKRKWYAWTQPHCNGKYYAMSGCRLQSIHRLVMNAPKDKDIDHINGDPLDNRKCNLRICTRSQNSQNKKLRNDSASGYKGVYEIKKPAPGMIALLKKRFRAYIGDPATHYPNKRHIRLGHYETAEQAAKAYDKKAQELHGEFAYLNFPEEK